MNPAKNEKTLGMKWNKPSKKWNSYDIALEMK